ncbi:hypothetical protein SLS60_010406 [Paraconiothyrium brasiliense]|uniref:60S ribosomal protein L17 n=1 Tax=Paraconiothyrium brasiliense TaxID=300254 RepID=A0ABR3QNF5_9PLEO
MAPVNCNGKTKANMLTANPTKVGKRRRPVRGGYLRMLEKAVCMSEDKDKDKALLVVRRLAAYSVVLQVARRNYVKVKVKAVVQNATTQYEGPKDGNGSKPASSTSTCKSTRWLSLPKTPIPWL